MTRFAKNIKTGSGCATLTTNAAGGVGYSQSAKLELISVMLTSFLKDEFYRSADATIDRIKELVKQVPAEYAAKCALFARDKFGMRSVSHVVAAEIAHNVKGSKWARKFFYKVVVRMDDATEIMACYLTFYGKPVPNSLKRGIADALARANEYQLSKYKGSGPLKMVDVVNIVHPKATEAITKLVKGTLLPAETWETRLSAAGTSENVDDAKAEVWAALLSENKLGYLAALRNVRNIANQASAETITALCALLENAEAIKKSRVFPFQIVKSANSLGEVSPSIARQITVSLCKAVDISASNIPVFGGRSAVLLDTSGSMMEGTPGNRPADIGGLFAASLAKAWNADVVNWNMSASFENYNPCDSVLSIMRSFKFNGGGTNLSAAFDALVEKYDRVVVLSDMQTWMDFSCRGAHDAWRNYCQRSGCIPKLYSFDLKNYGSMAMPEAGVFCLAGYSDKVFDIMAKMEVDPKAMITEVESIVL